MCSNDTNSELPIDMRFNEGHVVSIATYSVLLVISACGNITILFKLIKRHHSRNLRVNLMLIHLAIADLLVTFLLMPVEIGWAATVQWIAGDMACRIFAFFRTFGLFLSSFVLVCISIDRCGAILQPLNLNNWKRRGRLMLAVAWSASCICSLPQVFIFHVESHPKYGWYQQCVTFHFFPSRVHEIVYAAFGMVMMYAFPLCVFIITYGSILYEIGKRNQERRGFTEEGIRRNTIGTLGRARMKTLKMTITIVGVFIICWTPYNVMCIWFWWDWDSALQVDQRIQRGLFLFACTNSCVNPIVYGLFSRRVVRKPHEFHRRVVYHPCRTQLRDARVEGNNTQQSKVDETLELQCQRELNPRSQRQYIQANTIVSL